jgi:sterol desaturase/sphingolipid hydroxylase (fatty acid hydroxylase superfamily)
MLRDQAGEADVELSEKQKQFNTVITRYNSRRVYKSFDTAVSITNISLQIYLLYRIWPHSIGYLWQLLAILVAYIVADFVNGLVHMYMDGNDNYESIAGPLIANFHMHHKIPQYRKNSLLAVYFNESGAKVWLIGYLAAILFLSGVSGLHHVFLYTLVYIGILSSVAEVSHYLCHSSLSPIAGFLADIGLLLSKKHHAGHHLQDNTNYAFLNGMSDPLLNWIASRWFKGYKQSTDLHYAFYAGVDGDTR